MNDRDIIILKRIVQYSDEINGTITRFNLDLHKLTDDYVMKNAIAMCILQIGELVVNLSDEFKATYKKCHGAISLACEIGRLTLTSALTWKFSGESQ